MSARLISRTTFEQRCGTGFCPCHRLSRRDFLRTINAGAGNVKQAYQHQGVQPKCGDCARRVKALIDSCPKS